MRSEWTSYKIGEIFELVNGYAFKSGDFISSGIPVLKIKNVKPNNVVLDDLSYVSVEVASRRNDKAIRRGDILITMSGNRFDGSKDTWVGKVAYFDISGHYMLNQRVGVLRPREGVVIDRKCAAYFLSSDDYQKLFISIATSSGGQANLSPAQILGEQLHLPPIEEQARISELLGGLDDRITLLRETNATLEAIAQALFKSWFVDFDPVRAKAEGHQPAGMDATTAALFPDSFEESELGLVPKAWRVGKVEDLMELAYGKALKATDRNDGPVPVYGSGGITGYHDQALVAGPSIIVGRKGTVGSLYWEDQPFFPIDTVFYVKTDQPLTYCYYLLKTLGLEDMNTDGAVPGLNRGNAYRLPVIIPDTSVLNAFNDITAALRVTMFANEQRAQTLTQLRDTLLPRLISGQLRLPEAEALVAEAV